MALTQAQKRKVARRTTPSSKARLRKRYQKNATGGNKPAKAKPKPKPNPLLNPTVPLSGSRLSKAAQQLTAVEFASGRASLGREMEQATAQGTELTARASDYYKQLAQEQAGLVARQQAIGGELQSRLGAAGQQSQQALSAIEQEAAQRAAQDAAVRGAQNAGGPSPVADEVAAARALAARGTQGAQETSALASSNWENLTNLANTARGMAGGETVGRLQTGLANVQNDIRSRRASLDEQAAARRAENLLKLRQQSYENIVTAEGLGIDRAELQAEVAGERADRRLARQRIKSAERQNRERLKVQKRGQNITAQNNLVTSADRRRGQDITAQQRAADRRVRQQIAASKKKQGRAETTESRKTRVGIGNAIADLRAGREKRVKREAPPLVYQAAKEIREVGFVRPDTVAQLRASGVRVPQAWLPPTQRRNYTPGGSNIPRNKR